MNLLYKSLQDVLKPPTVLTEEQLAIVEAGTVLAPGGILKVRAYAGTGKTSTFVAFANTLPLVQMTYLAFNKSVETDAKGRFGHNVLVKTVHAMAWSVVGRNYGVIHGNVQNWQVAKAGRCPIYEATLITKTLETWLNSADAEVSEKHVEPDHLNRLHPGYESSILDTVRQVWAAMCAQSHDFHMTHSGYLKLYELSKPTLPGDIILLDEAQDTNPVTQSLVLSQLQKGKSVLMCGDPYQQIYAWRGAVDAMQQCPGVEYPLTQSWRFSTDIAATANTILQKFFNEQTPLKGKCETHTPGENDIRTTITRTNSEIFRYAVQHTQSNTPFHVVGREAFYSMLDQVLDVFYLYSGQRSKVMDKKVARYATFADFLEYAESTLDLEAKSRCTLVDTYKDAIPSLVGKMRTLYVTEPKGVPVYVTCHKAKGLEWDHVQVAEDFDDLYDDALKLRPVGDEPGISKDEVNLLYVAVTRAKKTVQLNRDLTRLVRNERKV